MILYIITLTTILLSAISGVLFWKHCIIPLKILALNVFLSLFIQFISLLPSFSDISNILYNIFLPIDLMLLNMAVYHFMDYRALKYTLVLLTIASIITWGIYVAATTIYIFAFDVLLVESLIVTPFYIIMLYHVSSKSDNILSLPTFWAAIGIAVYYACCIPLFSFLNYFNNKDVRIADSLFAINLLLCIIKYLALASAFYLSKRNSIYKKTTT